MRDEQESKDPEGLSFTRPIQGILTMQFRENALPIEPGILLDIMLNDRDHCSYKNMSPFSTRDAAKKLGISMSTLSHYIAAKKVPAPKSVSSGGMTVHLWSEEEIEKVRRLLPKLKNGRKKPRRRQEKEKLQTKKK